MFVRATRDYRWAASCLATLLRPLRPQAYYSCPVHGWFLSSPVATNLHANSALTRPAASQAAPLDLEEMWSGNKGEVDKLGSYEDWVFSLANATSLHNPRVSTPVTTPAVTSVLTSNCTELSSMDYSAEDSNNASALPACSPETNLTPLFADLSCSSFGAAEGEEFRRVAGCRLPPSIPLDYCNDQLIGENDWTLPLDIVSRWLLERAHRQDLGCIITGDEVGSGM
ncbi:hypothetical protein HPB51_021469 [Rhipicephalus microplus]|uniref:Uncharacterized protein n=1 Tax=Rhipicephalus microplus TaxID=6941 RepID=A0A9J6DII4_RHIMP|nr:hypothetical protein HPB51_021469 [Rhipicephalus microplus]